MTPMDHAHMACIIDDILKHGDIQRRILAAAAGTEIRTGGRSQTAEAELLGTLRNAREHHKAMSVAPNS
jgi:hypothetical protein